MMFDANESLGKTPAEVMANEYGAGTCHEQLTNQLAAIRRWLSTPDGRSYLAEVSEERSNSRTESARPNLLSKLTGSAFAAMA